MKCCRWPDKQRTDLHAHLTQQNSTSLVGSSFSTHETGSKGRHGKAHKSQNQTLRQKPLERQCLTKSHRQTGTDRRENTHTRYSGRGRQWDTAEALVWGRKSTHLKQEERVRTFKIKTGSLLSADDVVPPASSAGLNAGWWWTPQTSLKMRKHCTKIWNRSKIHVFSLIRWDCDCWSCPVSIPAAFMPEAG